MDGVKTTNPNKMVEVQWRRCNHKVDWRRPVESAKFGPVAHFGRASALQAEGSGFDSHQVHHLGLFSVSCPFNSESAWVAIKKHLHGSKDWSFCAETRLKRSQSIGVGKPPSGKFPFIYFFGVIGSNAANSKQRQRFESFGKFSIRLILVIRYYIVIRFYIQLISNI